MESALRRDERLFDRMKERLETLGGHGGRGAGVLRDILALRDADAAPTEGMFETLMERLLRKAGIEMPVRQYEVRINCRLIRLDFARPGSPLGQKMGEEEGGPGAEGVLGPLGAGEVPSATSTGPTISPSPGG